MPSEISPSDRHLVENEKYFRSLNERVQKGIDELNRIASEENTGSEIDESRTVLYFFCECSNRDCRERVKLTLGKYNELHEDRQQFVLKKGHEVKSIEQKVDEVEGYCIVRKKHA